MARHAHAASGRSGAFVPVNCASLPASLVEAELFGYVEGAFTGARRGGAPGLAKEADGGTLFLDEIGDMPVALQAVLLRFLDDWTVRPVGGSGSKVDVLLVSATNACLDQAHQGRPLPRRPSVPAEHARGGAAEPRRPQRCGKGPGPFAEGDRSGRRNHQRRARAPRPTGVARQHPAVAQHAGAPVARRAARGSSTRPRLSRRSARCRTPTPPDASLKASQRDRILAAYERAGGNVSETSRRLNVSRNTVYRALGQKPKRPELG